MLAACLVCSTLKDFSDCASKFKAEEDAKIAAATAEENVKLSAITAQAEIFAAERKRKLRDLINVGAKYDDLGYLGYEPYE